MPITVPQGVVVSIKKGEVTVTGPKGELSRRFNPDMSITINNDSLVVSRPSESKEHRCGIVVHHYCIFRPGQELQAHGHSLSPRG